MAGEIDWSGLAGSSGWNKLFDRYYRKREIYEMAWGEVDLSKMVVAGSGFSGPIALLHDQQKVTQVTSGSMRPTLNFYTASGNSLASVPWKHGKLVEMGWTEDERLVCVAEDGGVAVYSPLGRLVDSFHMGEECKNERVLLACVWDSGVVCLTRGFSLVYVDSLVDPEPRRMPRLADRISSNPTCMAIIAPHLAASKGLEVLLAVDKTILVVKSSGIEDQQLTAGPMRRLAVCPNGKMLACFTHDGFVWVVTSDFSKNLSEFPTKSQVAPKQLVWCGTDSVVLYWDKILLMIGPYGDWVKYAFDQPLALFPEVDGVRIVSRSSSEFLHRVPDSTVEIFKVGSCAPGAMLFDALDLYDKHDAKADDNIRAIQHALPEAVDTCVDAAKQEMDVTLQEQLLKAAAFGKCFLHQSDLAGRGARTVGAIATLRALNALRDYSVGVSLTYPQLQKLTPSRLVQRLARRQQHYLALQLCTILKLPKEDMEGVQVHWASERVLRGDDLSDQQLVQTIAARLSSGPAPTATSDVASTAFNHNRRELARLLLDLEPKASDQVPLLISMDDSRAALSKALESGDTDLAYLSLLHLQKTKPVHEFFQLVSSQPAARDLLVAFAKHHDRTLLRQLYQASDASAMDMAALIIADAYRQPDMPKRIQGLGGVQGALSHSKEEAPRALAKAATDQVRLLEAQRDLEQTTGRAVFLDTSIAETVRQCFVLNQHSKGMALAKEFKLPEKLIWWLRVAGLAQGHDWGELEKLSKERKAPPIGFEPLAEACIREGRLDQAVKYANKVSDQARKAELCLRMGMYREAAEAAVAARDGDMVSTIRSKVTTPADLAYIDNLVAQATFE
mmetsp:Transcript_38830/g.91850  ORF Transcript_38830/g.91850 Transcript_38830/m.91850 type:complete len:845 (+) Transcript_38830:58-2592(+)